MTNEEMVLKIQEVPNDEKQVLINELISSNLGFVKRIANRYQGCAELEDLIQEGSLGLWEAIERYNPDKGANFIGYAKYWIREKIQRYISSNQGLVRLPEGQYNLIKKYEKLIENHDKTSTIPLKDKQIQLFLGITNKQLKQLKEDAKMLKTQSLDSPVMVGEETLNLAEIIASGKNEIEESEDKLQNEELSLVLWKIVDALEPKQSVIIREKYQNKASTNEIALKLGMEVKDVKNALNKAHAILGKPINKSKLSPFITRQKAYDCGIKHTSLNKYLSSWTSSTERAILINEWDKK